MRNILILFFIVNQSFSNEVGTWKDYYSYNGAKKVFYQNNQTYCVTNNGLFSYNNNNELFQMGCIGKITSYIETPDYRLVLNLEGVCRFVLHERNLTTRGYYKASIDCQDYLSDLNNMEPNVDRTELIQKYTNFFKMKNIYSIYLELNEFIVYKKIDETATHDFI